MKLKDWLFWLCVAALLATEVFLFRAKSQKDAAVVQLREAQEQVAQLQADMDQLKKSSVATLNAENARLRVENQSLNQKYPQLQTENKKLRDLNGKLVQQLEAAHIAVQQQQQQLQEMQTESQQASASTDTQVNACINNLRQIDAAKQQWALENGKTTDAVPTMQDLLPYFTDSVFPVCPSGGTYTINAVGVAPTCSISGHVLPQ